MKNFPFKYEQLEYQGTGILRVPCIDAGYCRGCECVNKPDRDTDLCGWIEANHEKGCRFAILILDTPEAREKYVAEVVAARMEE